MRAHLKPLHLSPSHLRQSLSAAIRSLVLVSGFPDNNTGQHGSGVSRLSAAVARTMGLPWSHVSAISTAASLHDIGKVTIPDEILLKPGKLTAEEFEIVKTHVVEGARILSGSRSPLLQLAGEIALYHHERWDGEGYLHYGGERVPLSARIVAVADVFDALTHPRPYKAAWTTEQALDHIEKESGRAFDHRVVDAFLRSRGPSGRVLLAPFSPARSSHTSKKRAT